MFKLSIGRFTKRLLIAFVCLFEALCLYFVMVYDVGFWQTNAGLVKYTIQAYSTGFKFSDEVSLEEMKATASHPKTKEQLKALFRKDELKTYSEIGGFITKAGDGSFHFYDFNSKTESMFQKIMACEDWREISEFITNNRGQLLDILQSNDAIWLDRIKNSFDNDKMDDANKQKIAGIFKKMISVEMDATYASSRTAIFLLFMLKPSDERVAGKFHLHVAPGGPSMADKESSQHFLQILFEKTEDGYSTWFIDKARLIEDNSGIPNSVYSFKD